ncbi:MAG: D-alanyl-D-alanine carboxypeptidase, partial [Mesorhizobium sp.]
MLAVPAPAQKYAAVVIDGSSGKTLFEANSTAPRYPASLTKMMTLYLLFEALDQG